ncbi:unnamed protein product, partial [Prorocentrum cordatum]
SAHCRAGRVGPRVRPGLRRLSRVVERRTSRADGRCTLARARAARGSATLVVGRAGCWHRGLRDRRQRRGEQQQEGEGRRAWEFRRRPRSGPLPIHGWGGGEAARQRGVQAANSGAVARCETAANVGPPGLFVTVLSLQILLLIITLLRLESVGRPSSQLGAAAGALAKPLVNYLSATVRLRDWYPPRQAQWAGRHYVR